MAKRKSANEHPSAPRMVELQELSQEEPSSRRSRIVIEALLETRPNEDFAAILDFAIDHELIEPQQAEHFLRPEEQSRQSRIWVNPIDGSEMVWIPPGPFYWGQPKREATLPGFSLARHPVTNAQFKQFLDETGYEPPREHPGNEHFLAHWKKGREIRKGQERLPVVWVSLLDVIQYAKWANLFVPTEWQWEKAARGTDGRIFPWGDKMPEEQMRTLANVASARLKPVGSYSRIRTPYGCEDLIGNVSEWCLRTKGNVPDGEMILGDSRQGVVRGGMYERRQARRLYAYLPRYLSITRRNHWVGFRPAFLAALPLDESSS